MLPDVVYGDIPNDKGNNSDSEEGFGDEDEEDENPLSKRYEPTTIRRKKYRADDEVDALCKFNMLISLCVRDLLTFTFICFTLIHFIF